MATGFAKDKTALVIGRGSDRSAYPRRRRAGVVFALTNSFLTRQTLHFDGGEPLT